MADDLSLKAKRLLAAQHSKLSRDDAAVANASRILNEILNWCDDLEFQPGKWLKPNKIYRFDREYIAQINQTLLDEGYASIFDNFNQDNHRSAAQRNPDEKQGKRKPTHHLILAARQQIACFETNYRAGSNYKRHRVFPSHSGKTGHRHNDRHTEQRSGGLVFRRFASSWKKAFLVL